MTCTAVRHDTFTAYQNHGCRCPKAKTANSRYEKQLRVDYSQGRRRLVDGTGTRRRLQALASIGYSQPELAGLLETSQQAVWFLVAGPRSSQVQRRTAARVAEMYDRLADVPSSGPRARHVARWAVRKGWLGPLWWDDDTIDDPAHQPAVVEVPRDGGDVDPVVVDRLVAGAANAGRPTRGEREAAYRRLVAGGWSYAEIQERLHVSGQTMGKLAAATDAASIGAAA